MRTKRVDEGIAPTETVVVAHGLWMPSWVTAVLRGRLEAAGFATAAFSYASVTAGLEENAVRLAAFAAALPRSRLHFVGHSLGGVVAATMLGRPGLGRERLDVGRLVCLGSPLVASHCASVLLAHRPTRRVAGHCLADLVAAGGLRHWQGPFEIGIIAGDIGLGFGRLLGGLPPPHDGTVAVAETRLPGATAHRVLHETHTSLLWSAEVAAETVRFLRTGRFSSAS
ncbi:MAG TPA: alpha/beta hydrolase [Gammaproteobacteria bacterium]|nr:alpha/beta hydrolase [Gammaproteobacteria bacterium]